MPGPRQPTDVILAIGNKHLSKAEEDARRDQEIHIAPPDQVTPPKWLPKTHHKEFREIGEILRLAGLYTELDRDVLGQFFLSRARWLKADKLASVAINQKDEKLAKEWAGIQGAYFKQCRQCAEVLGLSISSRCRLVVPAALGPAAQGGNEVDDFTRALRERQKRAAGE